MFYHDLSYSFINIANTFFTCDEIFITVRNSSGGKVMFSVCPWKRGWGEWWVSLVLGPFCEGLGGYACPRSLWGRGWVCPKGWVCRGGWVPTPLLLTSSGSHHMYCRQTGLRILLEGCLVLQQIVAEIFLS